MRMLNDLHPTDSIYFLGYVILKIMKDRESNSLESLFDNVNNAFKTSFSNFVLALDWLYCINAVNYDLKGSINLCI